MELEEGLEDPLVYFGVEAYRVRRLGSAILRLFAAWFLLSRAMARRLVKFFKR